MRKPWRGPAAARLLLPLLLLLLLPASGAFPQEPLAADLSDTLLYRLLEICSLKGALPPLSAVKPYRTGEARRLLQQALDSPGRLTPAERALLRQALQRLPPPPSGAAAVRLALRSDLRANLSSPGAFHAFNQGSVAVRGAIGGALAYDLNLGLSLDKIDPGAYAPYDFTKEWDGYHIWSEDGAVQTSDGITDHPSIGFASLPQLSLELWGSRLNLQLSRLRRQWGLGEGSLSLSQTARPIEALTGSVQPAPRWRYHFLAGTLGLWSAAEAEQKMFSIHRLEWTPWDWLYLSPWESVVYAKRLELAYLNPIGSYFMAQHNNGDLDNIAFGAEAAVTVAPWFRLYFSLFLDEIVLVPLSRLFTRPNNQFAWQVGIKVPVPWLPFGLLTLQYTKIEPYCYTHYPYDGININYSHDGENLGYRLPPNSDELRLSLFTHPAGGLEAAVQYQLIRHGDGDHTLGQIEGDIDTYFDYADAALYPEKDFLHDGDYEWINILSLEVGYRLPGRPLRFRVQYAFAHAAGALFDGSGGTVVRSLLGLGAEWQPGARAAGRE